MANGYTLRLDSISTDGTNLFLSITINDGAHSLPTINPVFPVGTSVADINTYMQAIVNNGYSITSDIAALVGKTYIGA